MVKNKKAQDEKSTKEKQQQADGLNVVGDRLTILLRERGLTRYSAAKEIGCAPSTITNITAHIKTPSLEIVKRLCEYFDVTADYLLGLDDVPNATKDGNVARRTTGLSGTAVKSLMDIQRAMTNYRGTDTKDKPAKAMSKYVAWSAAEELKGLDLLIKTAEGRYIAKMIRDYVVADFSQAWRLNTDSNEMEEVSFITFYEKDGEKKNPLTIPAPLIGEEYLGVINTKIKELRSAYNDEAAKKTSTHKKTKKEGKE
jgi:transcriptional regulator with XRE-family HTH domain